MVKLLLLTILTVMWALYLIGVRVGQDPKLLAQIEIAKYKVIQGDL